MPGSSSQGIFLSYRRDDAGPYARLLQRDLRERFPDAQIFMDLDSIRVGRDFVEAIGKALGSCAVLVALIGRQWATLPDGDGGRRLDNPGDYVRFEVKTALDRGVRLIPVLVDGARPLRQQELPADLHKLARLNAHKLSYERYQDDVDRLLDLIQQELGGPPQEADPKAREEAELTALAQRAREAGAAGNAAAARDQFAALVPMYGRALGTEHPATLDARRLLAWWTGSTVEAAAVPGTADSPTAIPGARGVSQRQLQLRPVQQGMWEGVSPAERARAAKEGREQRRAAALARGQLEALLPVRERVSGPDDPGTLHVRRDLAFWTGRAGDAAAARDQLAALLPVYERVCGPEHPDTMFARAHLAESTGQAGNAAAARDLFAALVPARERVSGPDAPETLRVRTRLASWTGTAGDAAAARDQFAALVPVYERVQGPKGQGTKAARHGLEFWTSYYDRSRILQYERFTKRPRWKR